MGCPIKIYGNEKVVQSLWELSRRFLNLHQTKACAI